MKILTCVITMWACSIAQSGPAQDSQVPSPPTPIPEQAQPGPNAHQADKVRYQFLDSETPDGVVFQSLLTRVSDRYGGDSERTIQKVKSNMGLASDEEALTFIALMDEWQKRLTTAELKASKSILCHSEPDRTEQQMYRDVDTLSDINISLASHYYDEFLSALTSDYSAKFSAWVQETKGGFRYYVFKAEASLKDRGQNPAAFYQDKCSQLAYKMTLVQSV